MKSIGICLLAYNDEHIDECNLLIDKLHSFKDIKIFIGTNSIEKINKKAYKIINITESFNYNLKRIAIKEALKECDVVIMMDSDIFVISDRISFSELNEIEDGFYSILLETKYKFPILDYKNNYEKILRYYNNDNELHCIFEYFIILKISDENKKVKFLENWDFLYEETKYIQPYSWDGLHYGAMEGLIMDVSCRNSGIKVLDSNENKKVELIFKNFYHYSGKHKKDFYDILHNKEKRLI